MPAENEPRDSHGCGVLRINEMSVVEVRISTRAKPPAVSPPGVPSVAHAVTNAIFATTGKRVRTLPSIGALKRGDAVAVALSG